MTFVLFWVACGDDDGDVDSGILDSGTMDAALLDSATDALACTPRPRTELPDPGACTPLADDYAICRDDAWPACISDDGEYVRIEDSISSIARVRAFEDMAALTFDPLRDPSTDEFVMARDLYQEEEGLDSRVVRRFDPHVEVPDGTDCTLVGVAEMFPDFCVGPAQIQPIILGALTDGALGNDPRMNAARAEAGVLWFLYISTYKESLTCTTKAKDCDSAYAYYTGGELARGGLGLARLVNEVDPYAHDRAWDGALALRCWRDVDSGDIAEDLVMRERARTQYDRAVLDGVAAIVSDRLRRVATTTTDEQAYYWAFVQVLGRALDREYRLRASADAMAFASALAAATPAADAVALADTLDSTFDCP